MQQANMIAANLVGVDMKDGSFRFLAVPGAECCCSIMQAENAVPILADERLVVRTPASDCPECHSNCTLCNPGELLWRESAEKEMSRHFQMVTGRKLSEMLMTERQALCQLATLDCRPLSSSVFYQNKTGRVMHAQAKAKLS